MKLDITELLREIGKYAAYEIQEPPMVDEDIECTQPIAGNIAFTNTGALLLIRGQFKTTVALACSRCTDYFEQPVSLPIEEQFELHQVSFGPRGYQTISVVEEDESPVAGKLFDGQVFDLSELLRQMIVLAEPTRPLPPLTGDGRCAHCHRLPEEVLKHVETEPIVEEDGKAPINPAFAKLNQLIDPDKN